VKLILKHSSFSLPAINFISPVMSETSMVLGLSHSLKILSHHGIQVVGNLVAPLNTPNSGPVYPYGLVQAQNPADHDTYSTTLNTLGDSLKERQDKYYARV
jgi:hypothetical protein